MTSTATIKKLRFNVLSPEDIRAMSVVEVKIAGTSVNDQGSDGTLHDRRMGAVMNQRCVTCGLIENCPGHFGHIELVRPVYNPLFFTDVLKIFKSACGFCHNVVNTKHTVCKGCGYAIPSIGKSRDGYAIRVTYTDKQRQTRRVKYADGIVEPETVRETLCGILDETLEIIGYKGLRPEYMIYTVLPVLPTTVRPFIRLPGGRVSCDSITKLYSEVVKLNTELSFVVRRQSVTLVTDSVVRNIQELVSKIYDNNTEMSFVPNSVKNTSIKGLKQRIEGKYGLIRSNLMGKRVDYCARTVITPDASLEFDQIGVPQSIAQNLTFPEKVSRYNLDYSRQLIIDGKVKYITDTQGDRYDTTRLDLVSTADGIDIGYVIEREMRDDDVVVMNRQPTLHAHSMMGFRVKILPYSTFRLNLAVTTAFNADFDGDEMNLHFPQSVGAVAEVVELMHATKHILSVSKNAPMISLTQDSLLGSYLLTKQDKFFTKDEIFNFVMVLDTFNMNNFPQPAVLKPKQLWTGKQVFNMVVHPDFNYNVENIDEPGDKRVCIRDGYMVHGVLSKTTMGVLKSGSIIHTMMKDLGEEVTVQFINDCQKIMNKFLEHHSFSIGIGDCFVTGNFDKTYVYDKIDEANTLILKGLTVEQHEARIMRKLDNIRNHVGNSVISSFTDSAFVDTISAGSKGSVLNLTQIAGIIGQQSLDGHRIPFENVEGNRTLPHFKKYDYSASARGFIMNNYVGGLTPQEFWFHSAASRLGIIDTAARTAKSGYIARKLIKMSENIVTTYDGMVVNQANVVLNDGTDVDGVVVQFRYGDDGLRSDCLEVCSIPTLEQILW